MSAKILELLSTPLCCVPAVNVIGTFSVRKVVMTVAWTIATVNVSIANKIGNLNFAITKKN